MGGYWLGGAGGAAGGALAAVRDGEAHGSTSAVGVAGVGSALTLGPQGARGPGIRQVRDGSFRRPRGDPRSDAACSSPPASSATRVTQVKAGSEPGHQNRPTFFLNRASPAMSSAIADAFTADHHRCDRLLAEAERQLAGGDWPSALETAEGLVAAMERHFALEEGVLFPELAQVFQVAEHPIEVMVAEHTQMRALFADLRDAVGSRDKAASLGVLETLHFLVQQHNYKEEGVLYPMADGALPSEGARIGAQLADV